MTQKLTSTMLTSLASSKLTGALPAISGSSLTDAPGGSGATVSSSNPLITTNPAGGVGTLWSNSTTGEVFVCTDATTNLNVWANIGEGRVGVYAYGGTLAGYKSGGYKNAGLQAAIDKYNFASNTTAASHGNLSQNSHAGASAQSETQGFVAGGGNPTNVAQIEKFDFASNTTASDHGDLVAAKRATMGTNSRTKGYAMGGYIAAHTSSIYSYSLASSASSASHGGLLSSISNQSGTGGSSLTHGYRASGSVSHPTPITQIDRFAFDSNVTANDHADLSVASQYACGCSSATHGYSAGGYRGTQINSAISAAIDKYSFSSQTTAVGHGNLSVARTVTSTSSSTTHGYVAGGTTTVPVPYSSVTDKFSFASNTTAASHGNLAVEGIWATGSHQ
jgi:hypothetical protein